MNRIAFGPSISPVVRTLIAVNAGVFIIQLISHFTMASVSYPLEALFALWPDHVFERGWVWQIFTYMFLHGGFMHILFNMLTLWMFGSDLEREWGSAEFLRFYLISGMGAGLFIALLPLLLGQNSLPTIGASGAVFGILLAYAIHYPDRQILFMFIFPLKAKYFVLIIGFISFYMTLSEGMPGSGTRAEISHVGHLGGLVTGYIYLLLKIQSRFGNLERMNPLYHWRMYRQKELWKQRKIEQEFFGDWESRVDALLDKISKKGMRSLTQGEKTFLKLASRKMDEKQSLKH